LWIAKIFEITYELKLEPKHKFSPMVESVPVMYVNVDQATTELM